MRLRERYYAATNVSETESIRSRKLVQKLFTKHLYAFCLQNPGCIVFTNHKFMNSIKEWCGKIN